jgi:hypothetical protein
LPWRDAAMYAYERYLPFTGGAALANGVRALVSKAVLTIAPASRRSVMAGMGPP